MSRQMMQITLIALTVVSIPAAAYILYLTRDPNHENIVKNTLELTKSEYLDKIMAMGIDFPEDTRIIYENKDFNDGRFPVSDWAFFSRKRIYMSNEKNEFTSNKIDTVKSFRVLKNMIKKGNKALSLESFKPDDISFWSFWDIGAIEYHGTVFTSGDASILELKRIERKDTGNQNLDDQESLPEADVLQKPEIVPSL